MAGAKVGGWTGVVVTGVTSLLGSYASDITAFLGTIEKTRTELAFNQPWTIGKESTGIYYSVRLTILRSRH